MTTPLYRLYKVNVAYAYQAIHPGPQARAADRHGVAAEEAASAEHQKTAGATEADSLN